MRLLKTILVAVDFDDALDAVLAVGSALARKFGSEVVLTHVIEAAEGHYQPPDTLGNKIGARLEQIKQRLTGSGVNVREVLCLSGKAPLAIVHTAERTAANLILLGARASGTTHQFPLGTTTETIIRWSGKPVLAVPPNQPVACANIICPVDFSEVSARGLVNAIHLAREFRGKLQVLTVVSPLSRYHRIHELLAKGGAPAEQAATTRCQSEFDDFLTHFDFQDVPWEKHVLTGDPATEIVNRAKSTRADLIVMGSGGRTGLPYMFMGSTAAKVARRLPCALLTVKRLQVLIPDLMKKIDDINAAFEEGQALFAQGFIPEAITRFDQCLSIDPRCADAAEAKAEALKRLGRREQADQCQKVAETIRRELWDERVTASVRSQHPLFHRRKPYE